MSERRAEESGMQRDAEHRYELFDLLANRMRTRPRLSTAPLGDVPLDTLAAHMSDPRIARHMPLLSQPWTSAEATAFVRIKENRWHRDGLGHCALMRDGDYIGWGGFEKEGADWDFGLVLVPEAFGLGDRITAAFLAAARRDQRIEHVTFLLPPSRRNLGALARLGAEFLGEVEQAGAVFRKYRLDTT
jgi:RimJ/RimL family protein N-acetyltransferase